ncbi:gas vesicle protein [Metabacillus indicus]|uniref:gas vesicle protein n=1 Tax=Metabacillus indicus TaxID=246786 RepID=UPI002A084607|nr:gas vesicle protein [Metabacillus indicus]MDX8292133.1 gas vesicle protein [Metabacillus indicus]
MRSEHSLQAGSIVDVLERVLDKGVVIAGDIRINLADVELLTIKIRLIVASIDKAKEIGLDWWETDPHFSSRAPEPERKQVDGRDYLLDILDLERLI